MAIKFSNLASTTLASGVSDTATSISVTSASSFPSLGGGDYFYASIGIGSGSEVVKVTAVSGTTFTVVRGQDDTTAISHASDVEVALRVTAASLNDLSTQADTESVSRAGDSMTGDLSFGDNDKATFGASDDLQIYHDGNSWIKDTGSGNLVLDTNGNGMFFKHGDETLFEAYADGAVNLRHNNVQKLATTSTGIDVTGTATMDGIVVDNGSTFALSGTFGHTGGSQLFFLSDDGGARNQIDSQTNGSSAKLDLATGGFKRQRIDSNGDISFYEDTGTTPKLFWDASAESLTLGNGGSEGTLNVGGSASSIVARFTDATTSSVVVRPESGGAIIGTDGGGTLHLASNGSTLSDRKMTILTTGNVGIGTSSPVSPLHVYGVATIDGAGVGLLNINGSGVQKGAIGQANYVVTGASDTGLGIKSQEALYFATNGTTERMRIDSSGRVGIGTSSPDATLKVVSPSAGVAGSWVRADNYGLRVSAGSTSAHYALRIANSSDATLATFNGDGNVGIGTSSPHFELSVHESSANTDARIHLTNADTGTGTGDGFQIIMNGANAGRQVNLLNREASPLALWTSNAERMRIDSAGNVGIGTSSANNKLTVAGAGDGLNIMGTSSYIRWNSGDMMIRNEGSYAMGFHTYNGSSALEERMRIDSSGNVGIGVTPNASSRLHIGKSGGSPELWLERTDGYVPVKLIGNTLANGQGFKINVNNGDRLAIDSSGNTTITAAGNPTLTVKGSDGAYSSFLVLQAAAGGGSVINAKGATSNSLSVQIADSEKMRIDSSGNVGIGRTPTTVESAYDSLQLGAGGMYLAGSSNLAAGQLGQNFYADASGNIKYLGNDEAERITFNNGIITFDNAPTNASGAGAALTFNERMRIDSSGRVGIGCSPNARFSIGISGTQTAPVFILGNDADTGLFRPADNSLAVTTAGSERMRIDSFGNLLVGKTGTNTIATAGHDFGVSGYAMHSRNSSTVFYLNRNTTDGAIQEFYKDGTAVGSIGTFTGYTTVGGNTNGGLIFRNGEILPWNNATGAYSNGGIDLGDGNAKFKDLYLSGGVKAGQMTTSTSDVSISSTSASHDMLLSSARNVRISAGGSERVRIDSSGNLLVGKTSNSYSTAGAVLGATGSSNFTRDGNPAVGINRLSSDGSLINFAKDGTTVGSISSDSGSHLIIKGAGNNAALLFNHASSRIEPYSNSATDLGRTHAKFKDLHLSGTVNTEAVSTNSLDLQAIAESKSVTAVDVFVYDTSKDSDGGAWRHRTQGTSWYNEALNTSTRGATKKFPAVAVIVAESNKVTIYDGDDPAMPMWMVFNGGTNIGYSFAGFSPSSRAHSSIVMLNGVMATGGSAAGYLTTCSFLDEKGVVYLAGSNGVHVLRANIVDRNDTFIYTTNLGNANVIVNASVNDVAMTVLPNAPIDADTGLPVPTIAVATNGGVNVIKDDGSVANKTVSNSGTQFVKFLSNNKLLITRGELTYFVVTDDLENDGGNYLSTLGRATLFRYDNNTTKPDPMSEDSPHSYIAVKNNNEINLGFGDGLNIFRSNDEFEGSEQLASYITSDYNTGWMHGDIKLATLSDTDDTNVTGSELVSNGDFASNITGWTVPSGSLSTIAHNSGAMDCVRNNESVAITTLSSSLVAGKTYTLSWDLTAISHTAGFVYFIIGTSPSVYTAAGTHTPAGKYTYTFVAPANATALQIKAGGISPLSFTLDNISVRLAEEDRSVNGNGLQVFGTVTKTAVATGADLVAYSGFSSSNYLQQPYNSDLDFGTGDFSIMGWYKFNYDTGNLTYVLERGAGKLEMFAFSGSGVMRVYLAGAILESNASLFTGGWHQICCVRRNGVASFYLNGKLKTTQPSTGNVDTTTAPLSLGARNNGTYPNSGSSLALWRISATAPTAEQIAKMYRDEKPLFQENAKATLYGTSDAVTALAYDDDTELLHAGTSAGRSVFQGLRRVDNTTDAIGVAISASNDLVVEE